MQGYTVSLRFGRCGWDIIGTNICCDIDEKLSWQNYGNLVKYWGVRVTPNARRKFTTWQARSLLDANGR